MAYVKLPRFRTDRPPVPPAGVDADHEGWEVDALAGQRFIVTCEFSHSFNEQHILIINYNGARIFHNGRNAYPPGARDTGDFRSSVDTVIRSEGHFFICCERKNKAPFEQGDNGWYVSGRYGNNAGGDDANSCWMEFKGGDPEAKVTIRPQL